MSIYRHWGVGFIGPGPTCSDDYKSPLKCTVHNLHVKSALQSLL
jgi:hypothetical protein